MTTKKNLYGILAGLLLMAAGCADNNPWSEGGDVGALRPEVLVDAAVGAAVTRAQMEELPEADVPSADDFTIEITKVDGSFSKSWRLADYDPESVALRSGKYLVTASYGNPGDEGNKRPYFVGSKNVTVKAGETTPVNIEAALGNALVEITQTDNFLNYFSDFTLQLHSGETGNYVPVPRAQTDPTYVHPGNVDVVLSYANSEGKLTTINAASLTIAAKKYYHVKLDLDTEVSSGVLHVTFDNGTEEEEVEIDLSAVENAPEPIVTAYPEAEQSLLEGTRCPEIPKFTLNAPAGIQKVQLTLSSDPEQKINYVNGENLCVEEDQEAIRSAVESNGIKTIGIFKNRDKLAEIDLSKFVAKLNPGTHELSVTLTDNLGRYTSGSLHFRVESLSLSVKPVGAVAYGAEELEVSVDYNGSAEDLVFSATSDTGSPVDAEVKSIQKITENTGEFAINTYKALIAVPSMRRERGLWVRVAGMNADGDPDVVATPQYPQYSVEADAYANKAYVKVAAEDYNIVKDNLRYSLYLNSESVEYADIKWDENNPGYLIISKLEPGHDYKLAHSLDYKVSLKDVEGTTFKTEDEARVPNGDFEDFKPNPVVNYTINQGGKWTITETSSASRYQTSVSVMIYEPVSWASNNLMTVSVNNDNSWFCNPTVYSSSLTWIVHQPSAKVLGIGQSAMDEIPDVYKDIKAISGHCIVVRNVGWDPLGSEIDMKKQTGNTNYSNYYNSANAPNVSMHTIGKFFLGNYSYNNGAETYNEGVDFGSRPAKLKGFYKFAHGTNKDIVNAYNNEFNETIIDPEEKGKVIIEVFSGSKVIASATTELDATDSYADFEVPLKYDFIGNFGLKPTSVQIMFMSSNRSDSDVKVGKHQDKQEQCYRGATLTIDNLSFEYE